MSAAEIMHFLTTNRPCSHLVQGNKVTNCFHWPMTTKLIILILFCQWVLHVSSVGQA